MTLKSKMGALALLGYFQPATDRLYDTNLIWQKHRQDPIFAIQ